MTTVTTEGDMETGGATNTESKRVTIYVRGGVAGWEADPGVDVTLIDWDDLEDNKGYREDDAPNDYDENGHPGPKLVAWLNAISWCDEDTEEEEV